MSNVSVLSALKLQRVAMVVKIFGESKTLYGTLLQYSKPFIKVEVGAITRVFNESIVKEIIPC